MNFWQKLHKSPTHEKIAVKEVIQPKERLALVENFYSRTSCEMVAVFPRNLSYQMYNTYS